ncbi:MAG: hypothetical protein IKJ39_11270 [Lachnospiraceae bacterium]|nr:hypothetical protein [Lachnospiraceae bacterium]
MDEKGKKKQKAEQEVAYHTKGLIKAILCAEQRVFGKLLSHSKEPESGGSQKQEEQADKQICQDQQYIAKGKKGHKIIVVKAKDYHNAANSEYRIHKPGGT